MTTKKIDFYTAPQGTHWVGNGFYVHNFIPSIEGIDMADMDPFILLDYNAPKYYSATETPRGVGVHPHRGFETVTIAYQGDVEHHDSVGSHGIIRQGDVQWMTAAGGILHKEYHGREWAKGGGIFQMVQLWVNLPKVNKMDAPKYQAITNDAMAKCPVDGGYIEVIAGEYQGAKGPASTHSPMALMNARLDRKGAEAQFSFPASHNTALLVISGAVEVEGVELPAHHFLKFAHEGDSFKLIATSDDTVVLILSGEPLREPIAPYGPFVMNTSAEIQQAINDFRSGVFGHLDD